MMLHRLLIKLFILSISLIFTIPLNAQSVTLVDEHTPIRYLIPDTTVAPTWRTNMNFRDTSWNLGTGGIGFGAAYSQYINIPVENQMHIPGGASDRSCMIRIKFNVTQEQVSRGRKLMLYIRYDDGYVMHLNGRLVSSQNPPPLLRYNSVASGEHNAGAEPDVSHLIFNLNFNVYNSAATILNAGENLLTVQGFNIAGADPDFLLSFKLVLEMYGDPPSFESSNLPIVFINTNGIMLSAEPITINAALDEILGILADYIESMGSKLLKKYETTALVNIDKGKLYQAVYQITKNACEAMPEGGNIYISSSSDENFVKIEIKNKGKSIPLEIRGKIFEPYFSYGKENAAGLGLSIASKIIKDHNGSIQVDEDDEGVIFIISIPVAG